MKSCKQISRRFKFSGHLFASLIVASSGDKDIDEDIEKFEIVLSS